MIQQHIAHLIPHTAYRIPHTAVFFLSVGPATDTAPWFNTTPRSTALRSDLTTLASLLMPADKARGFNASSALARRTRLQNVFSSFTRSK